MTEQVEIIVLTADLFFGSQLQGKLQQAGRKTRLISAWDVFLPAIESSDLAGCVIDLETPRLDLPVVIERTRDRDIMVIGYAPHVKAHLFEAAREAGVDKLLSRGAVVQQLIEILGGL